MAEINCPKCYLAMPLIRDLIGRTVVCPECKCRFTMSEKSIPPIAESAPAVKPMASQSYSATRVTKKSRGTLQAATSIFDVFDLTFEKFVTPIIIRVAWVLFLIQSALWLLFVGVVVVGDAAEPSLPSRTVPARRSDALVSGNRSPASFEFTPPAASSNGPRKAILWTVAAIWTAIVTLLVRVVLEFLIVVFVGTKTLTEIRDALASRA